MVKVDPFVEKNPHEKNKNVLQSEDAKLEENWRNCKWFNWNNTIERAKIRKDRYAFLKQNSDFV